MLHLIMDFEQSLSDHHFDVFDNSLELKAIDYLKKQKCQFIKIIKPKIPTIKEENLKPFFGEDAVFAKTVIDQFLIPFINKVVIKDNFKTREARDIWRETLPPLIRDYYKNISKLRAVHITTTLGGMELLTENLPECPQKDQINQIHEKLVNKYKGYDPPHSSYYYWPTENKIEFVKNIDQGVVDVIKIIHPQK